MHTNPYDYTKRLFSWQYKIIISKLLLLYFFYRMYVVRSSNDISLHSIIISTYLGRYIILHSRQSVQNVLYTACVQLSNYRYSETSEIACDFYAVREPHSIWYRSKNWIFGRTTIIVFLVKYQTICVDQCKPTSITRP